MSNAMTLDEAKAFLSRYKREESHDHAFGDAEVYWTDGTGGDVATGYFGRDAEEVSIVGATPEADGTFTGDEARQLRACGLVGSITRNDSSGDEA